MKAPEHRRQVVVPLFDMQLDDSYRKIPSEACSLTSFRYGEKLNEFIAKEVMNDIHNRSHEITPRHSNQLDGYVGHDIQGISHEITGESDGEVYLTVFGVFTENDAEYLDRISNDPTYKKDIGTDIDETEFELYQKLHEKYKDIMIERNLLNEQ